MAKKPKVEDIHICDGYCNHDIVDDVQKQPKLEDLSFQYLKNGTINVIYNGEIIAVGDNKQQLIQNLIK